MNDENTKMAEKPAEETLAIPEFLDRKLMNDGQTCSEPKEEIWGEEEVEYVQTAEDTGSELSA